MVLSYHTCRLWSCLKASEFVSTMNVPCIYSNTIKQHLTFCYENCSIVLYYVHHPD